MPPLEGWPAQAGPERSERILEAIRSGNFEHDWCPIHLSDGAGQTLALEVSCDALKIDGVRVNVDAATEQQIADILGAALLTPKLADEIWRRATQLRPQPMPITSSTAGMIDHSRRVDAEIARIGSAGKLFADPGKDWVLVRSIFSAQARAAKRAANYGWHGQGETGVSPDLLVIQDVGTTHNASHTDYSQIARFARRKARLGELPVDLADVYTGRAPGTSLVSHEGPLPDYRQPGGAPPLPTVTTAGGSAPAVIGGAAIGGAVGWLAAGGTGGLWGLGIGAILGAIARRV